MSSVLFRLHRLITGSERATQADLGKRNEFEYDHVSKQWVERGAAPVVLAVPPPPPVTRRLPNEVCHHGLPPAEPQKPPDAIDILCAPAFNPLARQTRQRPVVAITTQPPGTHFAAGGGLVATPNVASKMAGDDRERLLCVEKNVGVVEIPHQDTNPIDRDLDSALSHIDDAVGDHFNHRIARLLAVLKAQPAHPRVCERVCAELQDLAFDVFALEEIVTQGGLDVLLAAISPQHGVAANLLRHPMDTLWSLTFDDDAAASLVTARGVEQVVAVMSAHPGEAELQEAACAVLSNLAVHHTCQHEIAFGGAVKAVSEAMRRHAQCDGVLARGLQLFCLLAQHQKFKAAVPADSCSVSSLATSRSPDTRRDASRWERQLREVLAC